MQIRADPWQAYRVDAQPSAGARALPMPCGAACNADKLSRCPDHPRALALPWLAYHARYAPQVSLFTLGDTSKAHAKAKNATDMAKHSVARLAGVEPLKFGDNKTTLDQLQARIERATKDITTFKPEQIDGSETRAIHLKMRNGELNFEGQAYLLRYVIRSLFFHSATACSILREAGTEIGKTDFIGNA